jgi:hypothetical protein
LARRKNNTDAGPQLWSAGSATGEELERRIAAAEIRRTPPAMRWLAAALRRSFRAMPPEAWIIALVIAASYAVGLLALASLLR